MNKEYYVRITGLPMYITSNDVADLFERRAEECYVSSKQQTNSWCAFITGISDEYEADLIAKDINNRNLIFEELVVASVDTSIYHQETMSSNARNDRRLRYRTCSKPCRYENCVYFYCPYEHPSNRSSLCNHELFCIDWDCHLLHPSGRPLRCKFRQNCTNRHCSRLHPYGWDPSRATAVGKKIKLKEKLQREEERERQNVKLPIWHVRDDFCRLLKLYKVLIVTAETGSGKTTQLAQYAAEMFDDDRKRIICTQPRAIAAVSIATRVALEFDDESVGYSVGYQIGSNTRKEGSRIMFMTDSAVIYESQKRGRREFFDDVRVLIIDEVHERSLNTDIVLGLAKLCLSERPNDFYVVVSSATIKPEEFSNFFECQNEQLLKVPNSPYHIDIIPKSCSSLADELIPNVKEALETYTDGNALVFLSGQNEIEAAIEEFRKDMPENYIPMALYGQMSLEEQHEVLQFESEAGQRMIVFCTNVAETSLTVPNIHLVIDSGWAKEAHYDAKRHVNIIKLVLIPKSSAKQRAGRAGRTRHGYCIQLYNENELERDHIEPEILRSSIDLVVLQLIRLGFDPLTFPYVNKPKEETIIDSITLLKKLGCIDDDGKNLTPDGRLFSELECDPRLSSFILNATRIHHIGRLAATIASILSAEKNLFYFGSSSRKDTHNRIRKESIEEDSDIMFLYSVYKKWKNSECQCLNSSTGKTCRSCRVNYSKDKCLNNRILETIDRQTDSICKTMNKSCFGGPYEEKENNDTKFRLIGECLKKAFPEQLGDILVPRLPNRGVRLINGSHDPIRADIDRTSVFLRNRPEPFHAFIAMSITKLSTGKYLVDRLHPITLDSGMISEEDQIIEVYKISKVGIELNKRIKSAFYTENKSLEEKKEFEKWIVYEYKTTETSIIIYAPRKYTEDVNDTFSKLYFQCRDQMLNESTTVKFSGGVITAKFKGGLKVLEILEYNLTCKLTLYDISPKTEDELKSWLLDFTIDMNRDIKEFSFKDKNIVHLTFNTDESLEKLRSSIPKKNLQPAQLQQPLLEQKLLLTTPEDIHQNDIKKQPLHSPKIDFLEKVEPLYQIQVKNLGNSDSPEKILAGCSIFIKPRIERENYVIDFYDEESRDEAFSILKRRLSNTTDLSKYNRDASTKFILTYPNSEIASYDYQYIKLPEEWTLDGCAVVRVSHIDLYTDLEDTLIDIRKKTNVKDYIKKISTIDTDVIFYQGEPKSTTKAAFLLSNESKPLQLKRSSDRLSTLYDEILKNDLLQKWVKELNMELMKQRKNDNEIVVYGSLFKQGELINKINIYANDFDSRYHQILLDSDTSNKLTFNNMNFQKLIDKWWSKNCFIKQRLNKIEVYISDKQYMESCINEITEFLEDCGTKHRNKILCDFCNSKSKRTDILKICGHHYCNCILTTIYQKFPFECKKCKEIIHIEDLFKIFSRKDKYEFYNVCKKALANYLIEKEEEKVAFCKNEECDNLMRKSEGYQCCNICGLMMCFHCEIRNDPLHENNDCNQYLKLKEQSKFLEQLEIEARNFLNDFWITNGQKKEEVNPCLKHGYRSFDRFFLKNKVFSISDGNFAFYAASENVIDRICSEGYEPSHCPLSVLSDIPGITFHLRAAVAFGSSKDKYRSKLIVTFLIKGDHLEILPGHGFQLKQRIDLTRAFELPILIVSKCN